MEIGECLPCSLDDLSEAFWALQWLAAEPLMIEIAASGDIGSTVDVAGFEHLQHGREHVIGCAHAMRVIRGGMPKQVIC